MKHINIEEIAKELREKVEKEYISYCNNPERDDDGEWIKPSLSAAITLVLDRYFEETYGEISSDKEEEDEEEFSNIYNKIEELLESSLNEKTIQESMNDLKENYKGLTDYERNSGKY